MKDLAIVGATVVDGTGSAPTKTNVLLRDERIVSVGTQPPPVGAEVIDATGKFVIPGLMDANVHFIAPPPERLLKEEGRYHEMALESAAVALRAGLTTVFDTYGPLEPLVKARDLINGGGAVGSRMFIGGNIIGFSGPLSPDFFGSSPIIGSDTIARINEVFEAGVGADLLWLPAEQVRDRVRSYLDRGLADLVKYGSSGHQQMDHILFPERTQRMIVEEAHRAGLTAQAHSTTPESLRMEVEAGADLLQHPDASGRHPIPDDLLDDIVRRQIPCACMVQTERYVAWNEAHGIPPMQWLHATKDVNDRRLIDAGARILLTTDAYLTRPELRFTAMAPLLQGDDLLTELGEGHFLWLEAVAERGMRPMDALLAATRNIAEAYGKADELGTVESGKRADLVILDADPLADPRNYRRIADVFKDGARIDRDALPESPWAEVRDAD
ncbi:amidohydrolase family protein [Streptomyces parvulus]|uniref:amidohydrolase family protein n=1 Tax=Streptomyces parvulus TaxID=146923 RepID=UPI0033A48EE5